MTVLLLCFVQIAFTRSLSNQLVSKGIRVNAVAPGPIWTPLIPATFPKVQQQACGLLLDLLSCLVVMMLCACSAHVS
jgi:NAD(P)-dependent dehydrogenase (short-subunit alcohol dehydrogenase family)